MKALSITNAQITRQRLLEMAEDIPGAWTGIRIAALLLLLSGWKSTSIASLLGLSRWSIVKWIYKANEEGVESVQDKLRPGRPPRVTEPCKQALDQALQKLPKDFGIARARWDGIVVVEYLKKFHGVTIRPRRAQQLLHELEYVLKQPAYRFVQASKKGVKGFRISLKKTLDDSKGN
jgi:transposase